ncbi:unnamed protein product [Cylicocyclus nassatus]|uniref:Uncharacterized protein n=1 Tax=Cylicocyclus nassatus TaxID=53992 RepID=A0AA36M6N8_CYLNA|nr:unnamed protein product [Cylicocyclus nassatus]
MGRHKRIPTKNRKKLKSVDPFNKNASALRAAALSKVNFEPKDDEQPMPRSLKELQESKEQAAVDKKEVKKRRQHKNKVLAAAENAGIKKGRFETVEHFVRRVERMTYAAVKEHEMLVKQGLVGRAESEIQADFKLLEEKEKRQKEQKKNEIQNKIKAARQLKEQAAKIKEEKLKAKEERKLKRKAEIEPEDEEEEKKDDIIEGSDGNTQKPSSNEDGSDEKVKKKRKIFHSDKIREKKKLAAEHARSEAILNQREIIPFGERYDAPPEFKGAMKEEMNPLMAKAGSKKLLLHSLLHKDGASKTEYLKDEKREKPGEIDRQRVIEAYRELKRKKALNARLTESSAVL